MKKRIFSAMLAALMLLSLLPAGAVAAVDAQTNLCEHHTEHTGCGYVQGREEIPCTCAHSDGCYTQQTSCVFVHDGSCGCTAEPAACSHVCSAESGCVTTVLQNGHTHHETCGYAAAVEAVACGYVCGACNADPGEVQTFVLPQDTASHTCGGVTYGTQWSGSLEETVISQNASIVLTDNTDVSGNLIISSDAVVNLCLNGKKLNLGSRYFENSGTLNICDCQGEGLIYGTKPNAIENKGTLNVRSGEIGVGIANHAGGTATVSGGTVGGAYTYYGIENSGALYLSGRPTLYGRRASIWDEGGQIYAADAAGTPYSGAPLTVWVNVGYKKADRVIVYQATAADELFSIVNKPYFLERGTGENAAHLVLKERVYTVTFDPNGGDGERFTRESFVDASMDTCNVALPWEHTFSREGYTFMGWSDKADYAERLAADASRTWNNYYDDGNFLYVGEKTEEKTFTVSENTTLYAIWAKNVLDVNGDGIGDAPTLALAMSLAEENATIRVLESYTDASDALPGGKTLTLDLNGCRLTSRMGLVASNLTVKNGSVNGGMGPSGGEMILEGITQGFVNQSADALTVRSGSYSGLIVWGGTTVLNGGTFLPMSGAEEVYNGKSILFLGTDEASAKAALLNALGAGKTYSLGAEKIQTEVIEGIGLAYFTEAVNVVDDTLASISVTTLPNKLAYTYGEKFDPTGMVVTAAYQGGSTKAVAVTFDETLTVGQETIPLTYIEGGKTYTCNLTGLRVGKAALESEDFLFTPPANLNACDGLAKEAAVAVKAGIEGVGSITVRYFKDGSELDGAPTTAGTYTVKINVTEGGNYTDANGLTVGTFTFDIADETVHTGVTLKPNENGTHDKVCAVCEKVFARGVACFGTTTDDCDKGYKCACGSYFGTREHSFTLTQHNDTQHWQECSVCHEKKDIALHSFDNELDATCSGCRFTRSVSYVVIAGSAQSVTKGNGAGFTSNAPFDKFLEVRVDGNLVGSGSYTAVSGSTKVTLHASYINTLSVGEHTLRIVSNDGWAETTFTVKARPTDSDSPKTGDITRTGLWIALAITGLLGLTVSTAAKKRCGKRK